MQIKLSAIREDLSNEFANEMIEHNIRHLYFNFSLLFVIVDPSFLLLKDLSYCLCYTSLCNILSNLSSFIWFRYSTSNISILGKGESSLSIIIPTKHQAHSITRSSALVTIYATSGLCVFLRCQNQLYLGTNLVASTRQGNG